jgi:hypothetical protein
VKKLLLLPFTFILFAAPMADNIFDEGFEEGDIPDEWQVWEEGDYYFNTWDVWPNYANSGSYGAYRYFDCFELDSWLVTPSLDLSSYENVSLSFWHMGKWPTNYTGSYVMVTDITAPTAADFVELNEIGEPPAAWEELVIDVSAYDGAPDVTFAFRYVGFLGHNLYIDDVALEGDSTIGIESASLGEIKATYR